MAKRIRIVLFFLAMLCCILQVSNLFAQCPPNIGFENGNFDGWECSIGSISAADGSINLSVSGPSAGRHTLIQNIAPHLLDRYGGFPMSCPNGSGYSIQLGNNGTGRQAERVSYTFDIPISENNYSIIYNYAVVFQNPTHQEWEQPKFTANVYDVTNNQYIGCSSFSYAASSSLPGFKMSPDSVFFKPWTPVTIKLSGYAGHTIRLEFTTNDCTRGGHFGYAYVDVNQNCSSPISGNTQCANDSSQTLTAPFGFASYVWFNANFTKILGTDPTLTLSPVPTPGTIFAVQVLPFAGQGCIDTVYTKIAYSGDVLVLKTPRDTVLSCISTPIDITSSLYTQGSSPNLSYSYFTDPNQINYVTSPNQITTSGVYYIKAVNSAGCTQMKPVNVKVVDFPIIKITGTPTTYRPGTIDLLSALTGSTNGLILTYWKDSLTTIPLINPHNIESNGRYFIKATNEAGCSTTVGVTVIVNEAIIQPPNAFSPNNDGVHDTWEIPVLSIYPDCIVEIYNRLGQVVYTSVGYSKPWDGKMNGIDQPVATYYYVIKARSDLKPVGGSVTIIR